MTRDDARAPHRVLALSARGFRNLRELSLTPGERVNVLSGDNGQGKSNVLEAIHYVASLGSFRGAGTDELIRAGEGEAALRVRAAASPLPHVLDVSLGRGRARAVRLDGKRPRTNLAWLGVLPSVLFHPGDLVLAQGGPDARRALLDSVLSELDPTYASTLADYQRALRSRNRLLKEESPNTRAITAFDELLGAAGTILGEARVRLVQDLAPRADRVWRELFEADVPLEIAFAPRVPPEEGALLRALRASLAKDLARGFTAEGPHADDVVLRVREGSAKHRASQGQQRALVLALKLAELEVLAERTGRAPLLLLDDVSSELDATRSRRLFALLARTGGQVFLTTTDPRFVRLDEARTDFRVEAGVVERC